ncbi:hypothetical protein [Flexivirga endophytica]|uniref:hypothetical protein n=1 Tax=Flexivirga endophytica TaxID=1849103 RepID=UPI001666AB7C|nr:hypothetical protein [Flexivirga endophytica]
MSATSGGRSRRRWPWVVVAVVLVALVAGAVGWRTHETHRGVQVGDRLDGITVFSGQTEAEPERMTLPVAFGSLIVTVGSAREVGERSHLVRAPEGATLVEVSWSPTTSFLGPVVWSGASARERRDPGADLTLVTGGRRYPIATSVTTADEGTSAVVVVEGDASDARVEARIAGRTIQERTGTISPRAPRAEGYTGCQDTVDKTYSWVACNLPAYRSLYVAGLGVAPAGKEWLVVSGASVTREHRAISVYGDDEQRAEYIPSGAPKVSVTVEGVTTGPRVAGSDKVTGDAVQLADRAWLVPEDRSSTVRLRYRLPTALDRSESDWPGAPAKGEVDVSTTTTYPAA